MTSRDRILKTLRRNQPSFDNVAARPESYLPVTHIPDGDLMARFTTILESLTGKIYPVSSADEAIQTVLGIVGDDPGVLAWDNLPLPGLIDALRAKNISVIMPNTRAVDKADM